MVCNDCGGVFLLWQRWAVVVVGEVLGGMGAIRCVGDGAKGHVGFVVVSGVGVGVRCHFVGKGI